MNVLDFIGLEIWYDCPSWMGGVEGGNIVIVSDLDFDSGL